MTAEEWKIVEANLSTAYGRAELAVDGYEITLGVHRAKGLKYSILVYVNGWAKGEWLMKDCEERRRFLRPCQISLYSPSMKVKLTKGLSKAVVKKFVPDLDRKLTVWALDWPSFGPLKRHLIANNESIEIREGGD